MARALQTGLLTPDELDTLMDCPEAFGPVAAMKTVFCVSALPKTRSGKVLRATMRKIADGESYRMPATIEDASVLDQIQGVLESRRP